MGGKLSKQWISKEPTLAKPVSSINGIHISSNQGSWIRDMIKPECLKTKETKRRKKRQLQQPPMKKNIGKARKLSTLEDFLLASPGLDEFTRPADCFNGGELYVFKQFSKRVHPDSVRTNESQHCTPRESFSTEVSSVLSAGSSSMSRSRRGKMKKKKVSFKLPEEGDIIIFYSPKQ